MFYYKLAGANPQARGLFAQYRKVAQKKLAYLFVHVLPAFGIHDANHFELALRVYPD
jgi:hypothetical protein